MSNPRISDEQAVELFRLRHMLRQAADQGQPSAEVATALDRLLDLSRRAQARELFFEHRRWSVRLRGMVAEA
jgi:hypothetical protein